jgi:hypothetical protein
VTYKATVTAGVKDLVGNPMLKDFEWSFQTNTQMTAPEPPNGPGPAPGPQPDPGPQPPERPKPWPPPKPGRPDPGQG